MQFLYHSISSFYFIFILFNPETENNSIVAANTVIAGKLQEHTIEQILLLITRVIIFNMLLTWLTYLQKCSD